MITVNHSPFIQIFTQFSIDKHNNKNLINCSKIRGIICKEMKKTIIYLKIFKKYATQRNKS